MGSSVVSSVNTAPGVRGSAAVLRASLPYFGSVALWRAATARGGFRFRENEHYQRRSQRNRAVIASARGPQLLSLPLLAGKHERCPVREVRLSYAEDWPRRHFLTLRSAYGRAPLWPEVAGELEDLYARRPRHLWEWNLGCVEWVRSWISPKLVLATADDWLPEVDAKPACAIPDESDLPPYPQVFSDRLGFLPDLCVVDLLLCRGPAAAVEYLSAP